MAVTDRQRREAITEMIAAETSCDASCLTDGSVHICERDPDDRRNPAHRAGSPYHGIMRCVTLGVGAVVTAEREHMDWSRRTFGGRDRDGVFDPAQVGEAARYWATGENKAVERRSRLTLPPVAGQRQRRLAKNA